MVQQPLKVSPPWMGGRDLGRNRLALRIEVLQVAFYPSLPVHQRFLVIGNSPAREELHQTLDNRPDSRLPIAAREDNGSEPA